MKLPDTRPLTYLITSGNATDATFGSSRLEIIVTVKAAADLGISLVQVREKGLSPKYLFELATDLVSIVRGTKTRLLINDRADIARAVGADGVHLTSRSLPPAIIREIFGNDFLIGVSTHSAEEVRNADVNGADFAVFGPVFDSPEKPAPLGIPSLAKICNVAGPFPVLALGGVDGSNYQSAVEAGAEGFAAIRSLNDLVSMLTIMNELGQK